MRSWPRSLKRRTTSINTTFIYALCEPGTRTIRYIGKSNNPQGRLRQHRSHSKSLSSHLGHWMNEIISRGQKPNLLILKEIPENDWEDWERCYIRNARMMGFSLVNIEEGGVGIVGSMPETTREKIRQKLLGGKRSLESRARISQAQIGRKRSPESIAKTAAGNTGKKRTPEQRARMSAGMTGVKKGPMSSENRAAISAGNKGRVKSEQECENISRGKKGTVFSPVALANSLATRRKNAEQKKAGAICS